MSLQPVRPVVRDGDLYLPQVDLWLDASRRRPTAFVSHAHTDHARARHGSIICTPATAALMRLRLKSFNSSTHAFGKAFRRKGYVLRLVPAGHVLGSAQLLVESPNWRFVYTGDFKLTESLTCKTAEIVPADCVLMEATYAQRKYTFPEVADVRQQVVAFARQALSASRVPVLLGYAVGKGPELVKILQEENVPVVAGSEIVKTIRVYRRYGVPFEQMDEWAGRQTDAAVVTTPTAWRRSAHRSGATWRVAMATGWGADDRAFEWMTFDEMIPLSDHADWPSLWRYVKQASPREVFVVHGYAKSFAAALRAEGLDARTLDG